MVLEVSTIHRLDEQDWTSHINDYKLLSYFRKEQFKFMLGKFGDLYKITSQICFEKIMDYFCWILLMTISVEESSRTGICYR